MTVSRHIGLSLAVSIMLFALFRSIGMSIAAFISGVFLDIDHMFDYLREHGWRMDVRFFFNSFQRTLYKRVYLVFHGWEWVILLAILSVASHGNGIIVGIALGAIHHLIADQCSNAISKWGYFYLFRLRNGFVTSRIFPGKGLE